MIIQDFKKIFDILNNQNLVKEKTDLAYEIVMKNFTVDSWMEKIVSKIKPTRKILDDLLFAFNVCRNVKSNAIVLAKNSSTIGIG